MKKFAVFCLVLGIICALIVGGYIWSSVPECVYRSVTVPASSNKAAFDEAKIMSDAEFDDISEYYICTVTADVKSRSPFKTEWMTFTPELTAGDIIIEGIHMGPDDVEPFGAETIKALILTKKPAERASRLEYYVFGRYHSIVLENVPEVQQ